MILTCKDFTGPCCRLCHEGIIIGIEDVPMEVYKNGELFAEVCCSKLIQAENRRDEIINVKEMSEQ